MDCRFGCLLHRQTYCERHSHDAHYQGGSLKDAADLGDAGRCDLLAIDRHRRKDILDVVVRQLKALLKK